MPAAERLLSRPRPKAMDVLHLDAQSAFAAKADRRYEYPHGRLGFSQEVNFASRLAKEVFKNVVENESNTGLQSAHENPKLAHHNGPHAHRVEYTLKSLILRTTSPDQQDALESRPAILGGTLLFPRGHDFWHQVLTGQRKEDEGRAPSSKQAHDVAAGLIMAAQTGEYEKGLQESFGRMPGVSSEQLNREAVAQGIIAQVISSPHGDPKNYEKIISAKKKAYTWDVDQETGELKKIPRSFGTEAEAKLLAEDYREGKIDPFSMNQAQMIAITTYELTHPNNGAVEQDKDMSTYKYGVFPDGLHPEMRRMYGDTLQKMAEDPKPFEDILGPEVMEQRSLIEYMGKLALFADTFDLVSDPTGRVIRTLLTQGTFTKDNPRPVWPIGLEREDINSMLEYAEKGDGEDWKVGSHEDRGYSTGRRLEWEIRHWDPFKEMLHPEINSLLGEVSIMAQLEQFRIIRTWMDPNPNKWIEPVEAFYASRVVRYEEKFSKREPGTAFDASWLHGEKETVPALLVALPNAGEYTEKDLRVFDEYKDRSLLRIQAEYGISPERMQELRELSDLGFKYESPYIKPGYDVVYAKPGAALPIRGLELAQAE